MSVVIRVTALAGNIVERQNIKKPKLYKNKIDILLRLVVRRFKTCRQLICKHGSYKIR